MSAPARARAERAVQGAAFAAEVRQRITSLMAMAASKRCSWSKVAEASHRLGEFIEEGDAELAARAVEEVPS